MGVASKALAGKSDGKSISEMAKSSFLNGDMFLNLDSFQSLKTILTP